MSRVGTSPGPAERHLPANGRCKAFRVPAWGEGVRASERRSVKLYRLLTEFDRRNGRENKFLRFDYVRMGSGCGGNWLMDWWMMGRKRSVE
jgi:hypothetical protein